MHPQLGNVSWEHFLYYSTIVGFLELTLVLALVVAFLGISAFLGYSMTKVKRVPIEDDPMRLGLHYEDISFSSRIDELALRGWYLPAPNSEAVIIIVHGADANRADPSIGMLDIAAGLMVCQFTRFLRGLLVDPDVQLNLLASELTVTALA